MHGFTLATRREPGDEPSYKEYILSTLTTTILLPLPIWRKQGPEPRIPSVFLLDHLLDQLCLFEQVPFVAPVEISKHVT